MGTEDVGGNIPPTPLPIAGVLFSKIRGAKCRKFQSGAYFISLLVACTCSPYTAYAAPNMPQGLFGRCFLPQGTSRAAGSGLLKRRRKHSREI
jgi:hypothetical protein